MSLWCSLLGHRFQGPEIERDREEHGEEVLTITREIETCGRCGVRRVKSENTEVGTVEPAPDHLDDDASESIGSDPSGQSFEPRDPAEEDTEILDDNADRAPGEWPPEPGEDRTDDGAVSTEPTAGSGDDAVTRSTHVTSTPTGSLTCPECDFAVAATGSSLRAGDSCPDCQIGFLESG